MWSIVIWMEVLWNSLDGQKVFIGHTVHSLLVFPSQASPLPGPCTTSFRAPQRNTKGNESFNIS